MDVDKQDYVILPDIVEYYKLKEKHDKKGKCPFCRKPLMFLTKNRILSCKCKTANCKANMAFFMENMISYDDLYKNVRDNFAESTEAVLKEKFDIIFNYKSATDISELRDTYIADKSKYDDMYAHHYNKVVNKDSIKEFIKNKDDHIDTLKRSVRTGNGIPQAIHEDLNSVLNQIHTAKYTTILGETILKPEFELENIVL
jgi:hypothetical protein